jgi:hypothetical protein
VSDPMVVGWQTFKVAAAVGCPNVLCACLFGYLVLFVMLIKLKFPVIFLNH